MEESNIDPASLLAMLGDFGYVCMDNGNVNVTICDKEPENWQELQELVFKLFTQLGYYTELEKTIQSVRSTIEIDVYAERQIYGYDAEKIIVECKNWNSKIPQEIVHSVRTVAEDIGANKAYIITKKGFQKGALNASKNTVIKLFTFNEFVSSISEEWSDIFKKEYYKELRRLKKYLPLNEKLCWQVGTSEGFEKEEHYEIYKTIANDFNFLFYHLKLIEQDIKIQLEENPEQFEKFKCSLASLIMSTPEFFRINNKTYQIKSGINLFDLVYKGNVVDELVKTIENFLDIIYK